MTYPFSCPPPLGGRYTINLSKANTHLIVPKAGGDKHHLANKHGVEVGMCVGHPANRLGMVCVGMCVVRLANRLGMVWGGMCVGRPANRLGMVWGGMCVLGGGGQSLSG